MAAIERQRFNDGTLSAEKAVELAQVGYENTELDYKVTLDLNATEHMLGLAKDTMAFANSLGGYILIVLKIMANQWDLAISITTTPPMFCRS